MPIVGTIRERLVASKIYNPPEKCAEFEPSAALCASDVGAWLWDADTDSAWEPQARRAALALSGWRRGDMADDVSRQELFEHARRSNPA